MDLTTRLKYLIQIDIDAAHAYTQAILGIDVPEIRERLSQFRGDHERHIRELSDVVRHLGGTPPSFDTDVMGFLIEGFTAIGTGLGTQGALMAMRANEGLTNAAYASAREEKNLPADIRRLVVRNFADEQRHAAYIAEALHG